MGFGDKFKDLAKQAQDAVAEHKEQITGAVDRATVVVDERTGGKYADKIAKVSGKAGQVVEKLAGEPDGGSEPPAPGDEAVPADEPSGGHAPASAPESAAPASTPESAAAASAPESDAPAADPPAEPPKPPTDEGGFPTFG